MTNVQADPVSGRNRIGCRSGHTVQGNIVHCSGVMQYSQVEHSYHRIGQENTKDNYGLLAQFPTTILE